MGWVVLGKPVAKPAKPRSAKSGGKPIPCSPYLRRLAAAAPRPTPADRAVGRVSATAASVPSAVILAVPEGTALPPKSAGVPLVAACAQHAPAKPAAALCPVSVSYTPAPFLGKAPVRYGVSITAVSVV